MKTTTILISVLATFALATGTASAQDDDDLFGDDDQVDPPPGDDDDGTGTGDGIVEDTGDGTGDAGAGDAGAGADAASTHKLGVGITTTVSGIATISAGGIGVEYWVGDKLAITGIGRVLFFSPDIDMVDSVLALQVGGGALFAFKQRGAAMLMVGGRFLLGFTSGDNGTTSIALEAPLRLQMKLAPRLSAHVEGGLAIGIGEQTALSGGVNAGGAESFTLFIGSQNLFGQVGLTAYF